MPAGQIFVQCDAVARFDAPAPLRGLAQIHDRPDIFMAHDAWRGIFPTIGFRIAATHAGGFHAQ